MSDATGIVPLGKRLIVQADKVGIGATGTMERPETVTERSHSGVIVAISADLEFSERRNLQVGDRIIWSPHGGAELSGGGLRDVFVLDLSEVWGIVVPRVTVHIDPPVPLFPDPEVLF